MVATSQQRPSEIHYLRNMLLPALDSEPLLFPLLVNTGSRPTDETLTDTLKQAMRAYETSCPTEKEIVKK